MSELRFDGRVAIITGAGGGLGRQHALLLASRGAAVVVNDLGGSTDGTGSDTSPAALVVQEIAEAGVPCDEGSRLRTVRVHRVGGGDLRELRPDQLRRREDGTRRVVERARAG